VTKKSLIVKFYSRNVPLRSIILYIWEAYCNFFWVQSIFEKKIVCQNLGITYPKEDLREVGIM